MNELTRFQQHRNAIAAQEAHDRSLGIPSAMPGHIMVVALTKHKYGGARFLPGQLYWMQADRVPDNEATGAIKAVGIKDADFWGAPGRILAVEDAPRVVSRETAPTPGALKILAGVGYDPGSACFRFHTALNETTKHASMFARWDDMNPHCSLRQVDGLKDVALVRDAFLQADVLHCHVAYLLTNNLGIRQSPNQLLVRHYHGSKRNGTHIDPDLDRGRNAKLLGARLTLVAEAKSFGMDMDWSPIPVPVARYRALRDKVRKAAKWRQLEGQASAKRPLRVAHSPTVRAIKGTDELIAAVDRLRKRGVPIELDLIHGVSLRESLERKALADVFFDSFWLGIQGSGLEAGAMEIPVIAGDASVKALYEAEMGRCPYTFADSQGALSEALERYGVSEKDRLWDSGLTADYVQDYHDYAAVAARYERSLAKWLGRDDVLTEGLHGRP